MTEEEKYINSLFKAAKNEPPKRSFEEVAQQFEQTIMTTPTTISWFKVLPKFINLNTLLMTTIGSLIIAGLVWMNTSLAEQSPALVEVNKSFNITQKENQKESLAIDKQVTTVKKTSLSTNSPLLKKVQKTPIISKRTAIKNEAPIKTIPIAKPIPKVPLQKPNKEISTEEHPIVPQQEISSSTSTSVPKQITTTTTTTFSSNESISLSDSSAGVVEKIQVNNEQSVLFQLQYTDNKKITNTFLQMIRSYGFSVSEKVNRERRNIQKLQLNISLYNGLDWKIKLRNFEAIEIKVFLDEHKNPTGIAYRLNQTGKFCDPISLKSKARSYHKFSKGKGNGNHTFTRSTSQRN